MALLFLLQNGLIVILPGALNGRNIALSVFLREMRLKPTMTYASSAPKLYNCAARLSSPEKAMAREIEEKTIIEMNGAWYLLLSLPNSLGLTQSWLIAQVIRDGPTNPEFAATRSPDMRGGDVP